VELLVDAAAMPPITLSEVDSALAFGRLISQLGTRVFGLPHDAIKVFLHRTTSKIAFNYGGLLYFNLAYFSNTGRKSVLFWYMTFAHELAHNGASCKSHNEAFAGQMGLVASDFMPALMEFMKTVPAEV